LETALSILLIDYTDITKHIPMPHSAFDLLRREAIVSLNLTVEEYRHRVTNARHFHLDSKDSNNAFIVAFPTVPQDSTGVAHILEHTSLCGSRRYPVRDPFFMMIRRSLNTFMNAFTASDWTAYPFATQNRKDFDNLLQVYLDSVFFPLLDPLDFAQEGHRMEFSDPNTSHSKLIYKGVVYNEMKGAMSSPERQIWQRLQSTLFPTTTYHYNSGGDPTVIPELTYQQLKEFHAKHYHPSNATFMTYGTFPVEEHQQKIEQCALRYFEREPLDFRIPPERRYTAPVEIQSVYSLVGEDDLSRKSHVILGWLLGESTDPWEMMSTELLAGVLLDNSASPLRQALETTDLGAAPSELCGLDDDTREAVFVCGLEGTEPENAEAIEQLILGVLNEVATKGVPTAQVEAVLHQLELSQREVGGGRFPYGLQLMAKALPMIIHGGDPVSVLNIDPILGELRAKIQDPEYIKSRTRQLLLDNPHRVRLTMTPDNKLSIKQAAAEAEKLAAIAARMSEVEKTRILELAAALKTRQESKDDPEILPKVGLGDIPANIKIPEGQPEQDNSAKITWFDQGTNGLIYEQIVVDLPALDKDLLDCLQLFCAFITEVGCGKRDYLQSQAWQASVTGGLSAQTSVRAKVDDIQTITGLFVLAGKALARNAKSLTEILQETFSQARFDELDRLRELVAQLRAQQEAHAIGQGHALAMTAASAGMGPCGALAHRWSGLEAVRQIKALDKALANPAELSAFATRLQRLQDAIAACPIQFLVVSEATEQQGIHAALATQWAGISKANKDSSRFKPNPVEHTVQQVWTTNTQINFCAKAYQTVPQSHLDAPVLLVLGPFLRNGFLHRVIREQGGAYGAGANYNADTAAFRFFSYRDPHLVTTLTEFDNALEWLQTEAHQPHQLEEAILNVISDIDRPDSPAGEAIGTFFSSIHGRTPKQRRRFRQKVLEVTLNDLKRVASQYLHPVVASTAVITDSQTAEQHRDLGLELHVL
jgi:Zn-dependent M16 (insulinase) family peptidase